MNIAKISTNVVETYIPKEIKFDPAKQKNDVSYGNNSKKLNNWQEEILIGAIDKLVNNIQVDNSHPLGMSKNAPIESYAEAVKVLSEINSDNYSDNLKNFGSQAQANVSAETFLQLILEN
ncbi:MAG: hypothetical protein KIT33_08305 [Candidatus Kapabacteria bacterium]|nr:hypothetical protein [Ignavibacteriota bacterium]MCW5884956.1 hypothetical protein [Candidatus Kapabacteria bacterium]